MSLLPSPALPIGGAPGSLSPEEAIALALADGVR